MGERGQAGAAETTGPFQKLLLKGEQEKPAVSQAHHPPCREGAADDVGDGDDDSDDKNSGQ